MSSIIAVARFTVSMIRAYSVKIAATEIAAQIKPIMRCFFIRNTADVTRIPFNVQINIPSISAALGVETADITEIKSAVLVIVVYKPYALIYEKVKLCFLNGSITRLLNSVELSADKECHIIPAVNVPDIRYFIK